MIIPRLLVISRKRFNLWRYLCLLTVITVSNQGYSQNLYVDRIGLDEGLSQNTITSIVQDQKGFMWFGTQDGLNRYDGYTFKRYGSDIGDSSSMSGEIVWALLVDKDGVLWVGTLSGLNRYNMQSEKFTSYRKEPDNPQSLSDDSINTLYEDSRGNIWVGTAAGLNRFDPQRKIFKRYLHDSNDSTSISNSGINAIFEDASGALWVGTDQGVSRFDYESELFTHVGDASSALRGAAIFALGEDRHGRLWIGSSSDGLFVFDQARETITRRVYNASRQTSISSNKIRSMFKDSLGRFWIGTDGEGLNRLNDKTDQFIRYRNNPSDVHSLSDDAVLSIYEDSSGVIWIGTYTNGISKLNPYSFSLTLVSNKPTPENPNPLKDSRAFIVSKRQETWVGSSYNGVKVTQVDGGMRHYQHDPKDPDSLSSDKVYSLYESTDGTIWVGTARGWLNKYDYQSDSFIRYHVQPKEKGSLRHDEVRTIIEDRRGVLWVGTDPGGVHAFDRENKTFTHYHHDADDPNSLSRNEVFGLYEDSGGYIWVATFGGGLNRLDPESGKFAIYKYNETENSISNNFPLSMYEDVDKQTLWIASYGSGIDRLDLKTNMFTNFSSKDGLADDSTYGILQDNSGSIWVSHNKGLSRLDIATMEFDNYDARDGLQSNEFNGGAYYKAKDGKLFFGGISGYNAFYPKDIKTNPYKPPVYITDFQLFNKPVSIDEKYDDRVLLDRTILELDKLVLSYKDYVFSLEFAGLDYAYSSKNQYAYKMEGLESEWNYVSSRRFVTYTTLPPGDYAFRVKASNNNGVWNEEGASLIITITPPFWQTWWFRSIAGIFILILVFSVYALRVKAIQARNKLLKEQVKERTADLEKALYELGETKDALIEAAHKAGMADTATNVLHNVGNILNSVNTSTGILREVVEASVVKKFLKGCELLVENKDNLEEFVINNPKGKRLLNYFIELIRPFESENELLKENIQRLTEKIYAINETIAAQKNLAGGGVFVEELVLKELVEDSISLQAGSIGRHEIRIERQYEKQMPRIKAQKTKILQILVNLFKNAKESMNDAKDRENILTIEIKKDDQNAYISYSDTGLGIEVDKLEAIFAYGYSTKKDAQGFSLHYCANYMTEMGGKLWAESDGPGKGAKFIISFPLNTSSGREVSEPIRKIA